MHARRARAASVERSSTSSDSSSGTHTKRTRTSSCSAAVLARAHIIAASAALHVVGAPSDQAVALEARLELLVVAGDDVEMAVQHDGRAVVISRADVGDQDRQAVVSVLAHLDLARLEPALHERRRRRELLGAGRVIGDEPLRERAFVDHDRDRISGWPAAGGRPPSWSPAADPALYNKAALNERPCGDARPARAACRGPGRRDGDDRSPPPADGCRSSRPRRSPGTPGGS